MNKNLIYKTKNKRNIIHSDENPKTVQIQKSMTRSRTKQTVDTLQQMVADTFNKV